MENPFEIIMQKLDRIENLLNEVKSEHEKNSQPHKEEPELMTVKQLSKFLSLSIPSIYGHTHKRTIPAYKCGRTLYFKKEEIDDWIMKNRRPYIA